MASLQQMRLTLKNTFLEIANDSDDKFTADAASCPGSLDYQDPIDDAQSETAEGGLALASSARARSK